MGHLAERLGPALRVLARQKRFATLAVLSLGVAIGLNTTMYSVLDALINPKVAMRQPERLYRLSFYGDYKSRVPEQDKVDAIKAARFHAGLARQAPAFSSSLVERGSRLRPALVSNVSPNFFGLVGNRPLAGRLLSPADEGIEPRSVVLSERLWMQLFPERDWFDSATVQVDGQPRTVVGVLSYESDFPGRYTDVWQLPPPDARQFSRMIFNLVRLRDSVSLQEASVELDVLARRFALLAGEGPRDARFDLRPAIGEPFRLLRFHLALIGAVFAVLLIACFNLANLQLARGLSRAREFATRAALGATRHDIIRQLVLESAWLAVGGLLLGLILAAWGIRLARTSIPPMLSEFMVQPQTSWRLFLFAGVVATVCLAISGLLPAIRISRVDINEVIKAGSGTGATRRSRRQYGALVVAQVGLALALMVGATLLIRTAAGLYALDLNPALERMVTAYIRIRQLDPGDHRRLADISAGIASRAQATKTVAEAATSFWRGPLHKTITVDNDGGAPREIAVGNYGYSVVSPSYLRTYGMTIIKGRDFQAGEFAEQIAIIDERTARFFWPGADPVGRMLKLGSDTRHDEGWLRVVGVVRYLNVWAMFSRANQEERLASGLGAIYVLNGADTTRIGKNNLLQVAVRGTTNIERLPVLLRTSLPDASAGVTVTDARQLLSVLRLDALRQRQDFITALFTTFAVLALGLAALGVYAVVSHSVSQRTREIGVRVALGATERDVRQSVLHEGNVLALSGIAVGLILAARTVGLLHAFLRSEEDRYDSWLYAVAALVLFGVTLLASYVPARRAMRINPVEALRND
jgi:predicted permease